MTTSGAAPSAMHPPTGWGVWLLAIRPKTLPAAVAPIAVGTAVAIASDGFHALSAFAALAVALLLQIAANLANDLFDFKRGADKARVGPVRVTQAGLISADSMLRATILVLALATLCGLLLVWRGGWPILLLGIAALLSALAYTAGPFPLGYHGLGDLFVFVFFGLAGVAGSAYVQMQALTWLAIVSSIPVGCLAVAIIVVNNLRDIDTDRATGKRTLAVRLGRRGTVAQYVAMLVLAYAVPPALWLAGVLGIACVLPWLTLPIALGLNRRLSLSTGPALNPVLGGTARLTLLFSLLFAGSVIL